MTRGSSSKIVIHCNGVEVLAFWTSSHQMIIVVMDKDGANTGVGKLGRFIF